MTIVTFLFFTGLVGLITWRMTRKDDHGTSTGYFLAGRTLTGGFIAGSLMLTNLSTEQMVGLNGAAFTDGIAVMAWEVIAGASLVLMALYFLPKYLRSGIATIPEFLERRFNGTTRSITSIIFIIAYAGILLPIILYTGATGLAGILDLKELTGIQSDTTVLWMTVWFIGILGSIYAIFGGLRTVAVSDTINGFGLLVGGIMIAVFGLYAVNDGGIFQALGEMKEAHPEKFNSIGGSKSSVPFSTLFTGVLLLNLFYWTTNQQIIQRTFGATSLKEGQKGVLIAGVLKVLAPIILVLPGMIAFHLYSDQAGFRADEAYGTLVRNVLPSWLAGFFAAVMVGAILSSFNSALNSTATLFSLGVYKHWIKHDEANEDKVIRNGKLVGTVMAILAMCTAPLLAGQDSIFGYLQKMNGLYFIPIFSVVLAGFLFKRASAPAANMALVVGCSILVLGYFVPPFTGMAQQVHDFHFLGLVFALLMVFQFVMSKAKPLPQDWEHKHSGDVDLTPWKWAKPVGIGIVVFVVTLYLSLADFSVLA
ncbi:MAG: solute:sodium symporter family transporter [Verrucomicrobia bacterium]|nr:solute:sodium symporter family transporter [Verrucomicrobiota bacterium]MDA1068991.1 solute:sodium symporter family transporter [Verrucomicrobiota bacterium]